MLSEERWHVDWLDEEYAWIIDDNDNYLFTLATKDDEGRCRENIDDLARIAALAPRLLGAVEEFVRVFKGTTIETEANAVLRGEHLLAAAGVTHEEET